MLLKSNSKEVVVKHIAQTIVERRKGIGMYKITEWSGFEHVPLAGR